MLAYGEIVSLFLILLLIVTTPIFALADNTSEYEYTPTITNDLDYSVQTWFSSSLNRAILSTCLMIDAMLDTGVPVESNEIVNSLYMKDSFVGKTEDYVLVFGCLYKNRVLIILYTPILKNASAYFTEESSYGDSVNNLLLESVMKVACSDDYYKNTCLISTQSSK